MLCEKLAGAVGFEPTIHDTKNRCLTTWPRPNPIGCCNLASKSRAIKPVLAPMTRKMRLICRMLRQIMVKCHQSACLPAIIWLVLSNIRLAEILCRRLLHQLIIKNTKATGSASRHLRGMTGRQPAKALQYIVDFRHQPRRNSLQIIAVSG